MGKTSRSGGARRSRMLTGVAGVLVLLLAGCGSDSDRSGSTASSGSGSAPTNAAIAAMVPQEVRTAGKITAVMGAAFPPEHFMEGGQLVGFNPDMANAIGQVLDLDVELVGTNFEGIIPGLQAGRYDLGVAAMFVTEERQKVVDFVTYFDEGSSIMIRSDGKVPIAGPDDVCGFRAALEKGTAHIGEVEDLSKKCVGRGKPPVKIQTYAKQSDATTALLSQQADFLALTSPAAGYAAQQNSTFKVVAEYASYPAGIVLAKGNDELAKAIQAAVKQLISDGTYGKILARWGMEQGAITDPQFVHKAT